MEEPLKINQVPSAIHEIQPGKAKKQRKNSVSLEYTPEIQQAQAIASNAALKSLEGQTREKQQITINNNIHITTIHNGLPVSVQNLQTTSGPQPVSCNESVISQPGDGKAPKNRNLKLLLQGPLS